jgi:predicted DNA binding CopG/RHH family protein
MATSTQALNGTRKAAHSVRTSDQLWAAARRRAETEGLTINKVIEELLEGYARGLVNLPKVTKTYTSQSKK